MKITILMPSLNEEKSIVRTIESIPIGKLKDMDLDVEIIVVDGGVPTGQRSWQDLKGQW